LQLAEKRMTSFQFQKLVS